MQPPPEILAALDLTDAAISDSGGATGRLWKITTAEGVYGLRLALSEASAAAQGAAMTAAAAAGLPVPEVLREVHTPAGTGMVISWLPGTMVSETLFRDTRRARQIGRVCGEVHRALHAITAPESLTGGTRWAEPPFDPLPPGNRLLHLDFHPNNILIEGGRVGGILDWENAIGGDPLLDLARTRCIMTLDPFIASLSPTARQAADDFTAGWAEGYGGFVIPVEYQLWAARVMLRDISHRHSPGVLQPLRDRIESLAT
ncbi:MAG TPA: phosphotransferase [Mycobacteriales bacterium]|nr:phosphotransferase [Mycobacteriales bacterium]